MHRIDELRARRDEIYAVARAHKAEKLWVFGSCARREERPDSDVDMLFEGKLGILDEIQLQESVSKTLGLSVDMVSARALQTSPCFAYNVRKDMVAL